MGQLRRMSLGWIGVAALTLGMLLSGCGGASSGGTGQAGVTRTPTSATATPSPTATMSSTDVQQSAGCPPFDYTPVQPRYVAVSGLEVSIPERVLDHPSELMPNNIANAPYQIAASAVKNYAPIPAVNPSLLPGYGFQICNETSAAHTLTGISVTIASFSPDSGRIIVWHMCGDGPYDAATKQTTTGCGGAYGSPSVLLSATLPSDSTGASAPATGVGWPVTIDPNSSISLLVGVHALTSQGTYTLSIGISVDGGAPTPVPPSDGAILIAPSTVIWTGTACESSAMQAHIPAASQDTYYVCPPAS